MKGFTKVCASVLCGSLLLGMVSCNMSNLGKGALIGGGGGAGVGAGVGALIGGGKGAAIGAGVGAAVGAGVGALIGNHMDKQKKELEEQLANSGAQIEEVTDTTTGFKSIRVTFDGGILFPTGKWTLTEQAKADLSRFASNLKTNPDTDVQVYGFTDNTGSYSANQNVSTNRADAVKTYLVNQGVAGSRISAEGIPMANYIASNETAAGRAQNRRVEVYITANEAMIKAAEAEAAKQ